MRKKLREVFGESIKRLIIDDPRAWWALKKEFDDGGHSHTAFCHFTVAAERAVKLKLKEHKRLLVDEYVFLTEKVSNEAEMIGYFRDLIIEELCIRADAAARRTIHW